MRGPAGRGERRNSTSCFFSRHGATAEAALDSTRECARFSTWRLIIAAARSLRMLNDPRPQNRRNRVLSSIHQIAPDRLHGNIIAHFSFILIPDMFFNSYSAYTEVFTAATLYDFARICDQVNTGYHDNTKRHTEKMKE